MALGLLRGRALLAALLGAGLYGPPPACLRALRSCLYGLALPWAALRALRRWSVALLAVLRRPWCGCWCSGGCREGHQRWCLGRGWGCCILHRLHGHGAIGRCKAASAPWLRWAGLLALLPCLPALGMGGLALGLLGSDALLAALVGTGLYRLPPACLRALRPWSSALRALVATAWSGGWWRGGREWLRGVGMRCERLRVAGSALGAGCPTDVACQLITAHRALLHPANARLECLDLAALGVGTHRRTGAASVATACNCACG